MAERMGTVPKQVPVPITIVKPIRISTADAINFDADSTFAETATKFSIPCVATITSEKPLAANIIKEIQPIIAIPLLIVSSSSEYLKQPVTTIINSPTRPPITRELKIS